MKIPAKSRNKQDTRTEIDLHLLEGAVPGLLRMDTSSHLDVDDFTVETVKKAAICEINLTARTSANHSDKVKRLRAGWLLRYANAKV